VSNDTRPSISERFKDDARFQRFKDGQSWSYKGNTYLVMGVGLGLNTRLGRGFETLKRLATTPEFRMLSKGPPGTMRALYAVVSELLGFESVDDALVVVYDRGGQGPFTRPIDEFLERFELVAEGAEEDHVAAAPVRVVAPEDEPLVQRGALTQRLTFAQDEVKEFHDIGGHHVGCGPAVPPAPVKELRKRLIREEAEETCEAIDKDDLAGVADGIADSIYVLLGTAVSYGIDENEVWNAVVDANLAKFPICEACSGVGCEACSGHGRVVLKDEGGKTMKPPGWAPPDVAAIIAKQQRRG